jgi:hypothetical protein
MTKKMWTLFFLPASLILFPLTFSLTGCHRAGTMPESRVSSGTGMAQLKGDMRWDKNPVKKAAIFLQRIGPDSRPNGPEIEFMTRTDGTFDEHVASGHYLLRSAPTTFCPVKGPIDLTSGKNRIRISVRALSFLHCPPGSIKRL